MGKLVGRTKLFFKHNSATILTCVGGAGVIATSVMAAKATPKALRLLEAARNEKGEDLTKVEQVKVAGPAYIPAVIVGASTLACIFGANVLNKRQQASIMSAYALLDNSYRDYKKKVADMLGKEAHEEVIAEIAKDKLEEVEIGVEGDEKLFFDSFSGQYFESTIEKVQEAEYQINRDLSMRDYATVNEFYDYLGIPHIDAGDDIGWSTGMNFDYYWQSWIDFGHRKVTLDYGLECIIITMFAEPTLGWDEYY